MKNNNQRQTCKVCGRIDKFNFHVPDKIWEAVIPPIFRTKVVGLTCFDDFAFKNDVDYSKCLEVPYFAGNRAVFEFEVKLGINVRD